MRGTPLQKVLAILAVLAVLLGLTAYWVAAPLLALRDLQQAAQAGDAERFNAHVDYVRLRESLKLQLADPLMRSMDDNAAGAPDDSWQQAGAALGALLGRAVIDHSVDLLVRPETVMHALQEGRMLALPKRKHPAPRPPADGASDAAGRDDKVQWITERDGLDRYVAWAVRPGQAADQRLGLVLLRSGFATWRLSEVRLPRPR